ncbi:MAG: protein-L-isoaspartate(D-aspartate) O-methyltransferase [Bacteroidota bacterium]
MRKSLVRVIKQKGIDNQAVLNAIGTVPRHYFFDEIFVEHAYQDKAFPIGEGQTISQPYTVAFQTQQLAVSRGDRVLEIGTGSGYQACVLCELGVKLYTIEYQRKLYEQARSWLPQMGYQPMFFHGDGSLGLPQFAPYDAIIVTAGAPSIPSSLIKQLKDGGRLIIPVGNNKSQKMVRLTKVNEKQIKKEEFDTFSFVPLLGEQGWNN